MAVPKLRRKSTKPSCLKIIVIACSILLCISVALLLTFTIDESKQDTIGTKEDGKQSISKPLGTVGDASSVKRVNSPKEDSKVKRANSPKYDPPEVMQTKKDTKSDSTNPFLVTMKTSQGDLRINLRPDLSLASVQYIQKLLESSKPCKDCRFYRAEKPGILQGVIQKEGIMKNTILGDCPEEFKGLKHDCPKHDPNCGCHGPMMTRGMIGWAAGKGGPDFFIDTYKRDATWWNTDHTVWGELADKESLDVAMSFYELPSTKRRSMTFLDKSVYIELTH